MDESEKKRLMSLKQKRQAFRMQKQTIHNSLKFIDKNKSNKKILFNDIVEIQNSEKRIENISNKKNTLFSSDNEDEKQFHWNEEDFDAKAKLKQKLLKLQPNVGNDKRFILDERFINNEDKIDRVTFENKDDKIKFDEKKWQINILEDVIKKSIMSDNCNNILKKKHTMIRYDPTANNHQDYEVIIEKSNVDNCNKKEQKKKIKIKEDTSIPKSNELFYDVSEYLIQSLKPNKQFSLLQTFGHKTTNIDSCKNHFDNKSENCTSFQINFNPKKFKYDSSDSENEEMNEKNVISLPEITESDKFHGKINGRLFFYDNDTRFDEARDFFKNYSSHEENVFKYKRCKLKEIVRSKIRKNLKKSTPWNKKRICKIQKKK